MATIRLEVYDPLGRLLQTLSNGRYQVGVHTVVFSAGGLPSGTYYYRLTAEDFVAVRKMQLLK